jgi:signal transduction histidine kinase
VTPLDAAAVLSAAPDGVVVADAEGLVVAVNVAAAKLTGLDPAAALGDPLAQVLPLEDSKGRAWWSCVDPYHGLVTRTGHPEVELTLPERGSLLVTASYLRAAGPRTPVTSVVVGLRGTAGRERLERDRAELVATVAHELRSPLTSVKGFTSTLLAKWEFFTDEQRKLMLETVEADADRVTRLITELLDVARIDSGRLELHLSLVDLPQLLAGQVARLTGGGEPAERFALHVADGLPETWGDSDKLQQVFANLLENALRHGDGRVTVRVRTAGVDLVTPAGPAAAPATEVTVSDEGAGVPPEAAARVFTKFWRGGRRGGTGLGLYIAKGMVELHDGTIALGSAPGGGAQFVVVLPAGTPPG